MLSSSYVLGGRVLVEEINGSMMGMPFTGHGMMGFDNVSGKYWSTWNDSMSTGIMVSDSTCDSQNKTCTFTGSWNDALKKGPVRARMTTRWTSPTIEMFEMYGPGKDGKEMKMIWRSPTPGSSAPAATSGVDAQASPVNHVSLRRDRDQALQNVIEHRTIRYLRRSCESRQARAER